MGSLRASLKGDGLGKITHAASLRGRPASAEDRALPGHWEGDLIAGSHNSYIATLVERHTRYVMLVKVESKDTDSVVSALIKQAKLYALARQLNERLRKTLDFEMPVERFNACVASNGRAGSQ